MPLTSWALQQVHEGTRVEHLAASLYRLSTGSAAGALQAAEAESMRTTDDIETGTEQGQSPFSKRPEQMAGKHLQSRRHT